MRAPRPTGISAEPPTPKAASPGSRPTSSQPSNAPSPKRKPTADNEQRDGLKRLWGRRQAFKLRPRQEELFESLLPRIRIELPDAPPGSIDPYTLFLDAIAFPPPLAGEVSPGLDTGDGRGLSHRPVSPLPLGGAWGRASNKHEHLPQIPLPNPLPNPPPKGEGNREVSLEIGFGGGEHLIEWARQHPDEGFIGAEPFINGMAKMLAHIDDTKLANIRLFAGDARRLIEALRDASIARVFLLFPDPWPKLRHHKRRYVQDDTLAEIARVLKDGGMLRIASDIPGYIDWTLERMARRPEFARTAQSLHAPHERPADWPQTRYEQKALREARVPAYLDYIRAPRS